MDISHSKEGGNASEFPNSSENRRKKNGLYEFNFDEIITDDVSSDDALVEEITYIGDEEEDGFVEDAAEETRKKKLKTRRNVKKGFRYSVGVLTWVKDIAIALAIIWVLTTFVASFITVKDDFMAPTVVQGEHVVVIKFRYYFAGPDRGEVIVFKDTGAAESGEKRSWLQKIVGSKDGKTLMSRVIGLPGDTIIIDPQGQILVNGVPFITDYSDGTTTFVPGQVSYPYTVPEDCYFVLCDNPVSTGDSRFTSVGTVHKDEIVGEVFCCFWPRSAWRPIR